MDMSSNKPVLTKRKPGRQEQQRLHRLVYLHANVSANAHAPSIGGNMSEFMDNWRSRIAPPAERFGLDILSPPTSTCSVANAGDTYHYRPNQPPRHVPVTNTKSLQLDANALAATLDGTPGALLALVHAGYRQWTKTQHLTFPPARRDELLREILHFCADTHLLECPPEDGCRPQAIADMLDARYPRYARRKAASYRKR